MTKGLLVGVAPAAAFAMTLNIVDALGSMELYAAMVRLPPALNGALRATCKGIQL
jgi:hypothetical protein